MNPGPWVYVFSGSAAEDSVQGQRYRYEVRETVGVSGSHDLKIKKGEKLLRVECSGPLSPAQAEKAQWRGVVRHLQYTGEELRQELQAQSAKEYAASDETLAVFIPIRKSPAWWSLAQDKRQEHFHKKSTGSNHSTVGLRYADRIFRKLYHARYFDTLPDYDFLTYFEFKRQDEDIFRSLLKDLRDPGLNPEWKYVEMETEVWTVKK